ncbi:MAG: LPXTG cell wall anchor domain-containing protein [Pseudobutyrivibrio ruminis]|nr:LPXTG cell wall anchor domain-containing protein [Pseudobutyrivibrio ruminis]
MKKIKKIIALALATVMMMAMSITAFAEETEIVYTTNNATITITNISKRDAETSVSIYPLAYVNTKTNTVDVLSWAEKLYPVDKTTEPYQELVDNFDATKLKNALPATALQTTVSENGAAVNFENLKGGVYVITITGANVIYNPLVVKAYKSDSDGNYEAKDETAVAKPSTNVVEKTTTDGHVKAGQIVEGFHITSTVPYNKNEYKVFDKVTNLEILLDTVKVTVGGEDASFTFIKGDDGVYTMDLTSLVVGDEATVKSNVGKTIEITYDAKVVGVGGYSNQAYDSTYEFKDGEPVNPPTVYGYSTDITLIKTNTEGDTYLENAEFTVTKLAATDADENTELKFVYNNDTKAYELSDAEDAEATIKTDKNGEVKICGLDEGEYHFTETKAPEGYAINPDGITVTVNDMSEELRTVSNDKLTEAQNKELHKKGEDTTLKDSTLAQLPFTGGMGTTIFTVLGVAIMVLAATLYFVSKRKATK